MMSLRPWLTTAFLSSLLLFGLISCKKQKDSGAEVLPQQPVNPPPGGGGGTDTQNANVRDAMIFEHMVSDLMLISAQITENSTLTTYKSPESGAPALLVAPCATISNNGAAPPTSYTVDFGMNCQGPDGRSRKGKLVFNTISGPGPKFFRHPAFNVGVTSGFYGVNEFTVDIVNLQVKNTSPLSMVSQTAYAGTNLTWSVSASLRFIRSKGGIKDTSVWNGTRTMELVNSNDPAVYKGQMMQMDLSKAQLKFNGNASGQTPMKEPVTITTVDLARDFLCAPDPNLPRLHPYIKGVLDCQVGNKALRHINFGNGECDLNSTLTVNGTVTPFPIPQ